MLFLDFSSQRLKKAATSLKLNDIQPDLILAFLDHLERERHNAVRSRNLRLKALRAFLKFAGRSDVASLHVIEQALAVPMKRFERPMLAFLTREEMLAVLGQPGETWTSQRDHLPGGFLPSPTSAWPRPRCAVRSHSRAFGGGLFELRPRGRSGIGRAFYCFLVGKRVIVLHAFKKKSQEIPDRELKLARKRMKEVSNG